MILLLGLCVIGLMLITIILAEKVAPHACLFAQRWQLKSKLYKLLWPWLAITVIFTVFIQIYWIPSSSLSPSVLPGELIVVNPLAYGLNFGGKYIWRTARALPRRGDIIVFRKPKLTSKDLVKRVIGLPGDVVQYHHKRLYINHRLIPEIFLHYAIDHADQQFMLVKEELENLDGIRHLIYVDKRGGDWHRYTWRIPRHEYLVMGDNRDDSRDSRSWGFVKQSKIIGRAEVVIFSWNRLLHELRWQRIGKVL